MGGVLCQYSNIFHVNISIFVFSFPGKSQCSGKLCECIYATLNNPEFHNVFALSIPTINQLKTSGHVRIHTSRTESAEEAKAAQFQMQFDSAYATPEATKDIIDSSVKPYTSGQKSFTTACMHSYTIDFEPQDHWDFHFTDPRFTEQTNTGIGRFTLHIGDIYIQCEILTIFHRQFFATAYPDGKMYDSKTNLPCGTYNEVYNRDYFKKCNPRKWQWKLRKYDERDAGKVTYHNWRFTIKNKKELNLSNTSEKNGTTSSKDVKKILLPESSPQINNKLVQLDNPSEKTQIPILNVNQ